MPPHLHFGEGSWVFPVSLTVILFLAGFLYLGARISTRSASTSTVPGWRVSGFFAGLLFIWTAWGSPLAAYDHYLLTVHMIKHLLLMTVAPPLILLGEPVRAVWGVMLPLARNWVVRLSQRPFVERSASILSSLAFCWTVSAFTLIAWHVPALFALGMHSEIGHTVEQATFLGSGFLFWWPVVNPWPSASIWPRWSILIYLFLATLPCDILSGFLVFSDRVAYPVYFSAPRMFGFSVLADQQCAAALMWTCVTLIYLVPAAILSVRLLAPRAWHENNGAPAMEGLEGIPK